MSSLCLTLCRADERRIADSFQSQLEKISSLLSLPKVEPSLPHSLSSPSQSPSPSTSHND